MKKDDFSSNKVTEGNPKKKFSFLVFFASAALLIVIVFSFILAPIMNPDIWTSKDGSLVFGKYGPHEIAYRPGNFFSKQLEYMIEQASSEGYDIKTSFAQYSLWLQAFRIASKYTILLDYAQRSSIKIAPDQLMQAIKKSGYFYKNGSFSREEFDNTPLNRKSSIVQNLKDMLLVSVYQNRFSEHNLRSEKSLKDLAYPFGQSRKFDFFIFKFDHFPERNIRLFAEENQKMFQSIHVKRILFEGNKQAAAKLYTSLSNGEKDFSTVFIESSREEFANESITAKEGNLGEVFFYQVENSLKNPEKDISKIFDLKINEYSLPLAYKTSIKKKLVYAIYFIEKPNIALDLSNLEKYNTIRTYFLENRKDIITDYFLSLASKIKKEDFSSTIVNPGKKITSSYFSQVYGLDSQILQKQSQEYHPYKEELNNFLSSLGKSGEDIMYDALKSREFFTNAFSLKLNEISKPIILDNALILLKFLDYKLLTKNNELNMKNDFSQLKNYLSENLLVSLVESALKSSKYKNNFNEIYATRLAENLQNENEIKQSEPLSSDEEQTLE